MARRGLFAVIGASAIALAASPLAADAAQFDGAAFDGSLLGLAWGLPFAGMLLSIALFPILAPRVWHRHFGKIAAAWALLFVVPFALRFGTKETTYQLAHAALLEYLPFIILLLALYTVAGGICVLGNLHGSPALNTGVLAAGTLLANVMGTTGAAMVLIRPLIRANDRRKHTVHIFIFFIFLVANAGGALTPLGDPPLFLGFLKGVSFFWTTDAMLLPMVTLCGALLALFYLLDAHFYARGDEQRPSAQDPSPDTRVRLIGKANIVLLVAIVAAVLMSGLWKPGIAYAVLGSQVELQNLVRDVLLVAIALVSLWITPADAHAGNDFNWGPIQEVAKLFAAIFVTIIPVIAILRAGQGGALAPLVQLVTSPAGEPINPMYFWLTGILSAFLDNAPTYLIFFNLAGGDPVYLMAHREALAAISAGAVFMGALSYIGNAPNFMVKAIAEDRGIAMPSFFGYMAWSCTILLPLFVVLTFLFFR